MNVLYTFSLIFTNVLLVGLSSHFTDEKVRSGKFSQENIANK